MSADFYDNYGEYWTKGIIKGKPYASCITLSIDDMYDFEGGYPGFLKGVRPVFHIKTPEVSDIKFGDKIKVAGYPCTIISTSDGSATALCDDCLFHSEFSVFNSDGNIVEYENSEVKKNLENFFKDKALNIEFVENQTLDEILEDKKPDYKDISPDDNLSDEILENR